MAAGLASRSLSEQLPEFVSLHAGDALWAAMIYCSLRAIASHKRLRWALACSLCFCFFIEFSQLYQAGWLNAIRDTALGGLVLGQGFLFVDLIRYVTGIIVISILDRFGALFSHKAYQRLAYRDK